MAYTQKELGLTKSTQKLLKRNEEVLPLYAFGPVPERTRTAHLQKLARESYLENENER